MENLQLRSMKRSLSSSLFAFALAAFLSARLACGGSPNWTWMKGSNTISHVGVYGTKGAPDAANLPGSRSSAAVWTSKDGTFWLFGGGGNSSAGTGDLNDLWKRDPDSGFWIWVSGSNLPNKLGVYGVKGVPDPANSPGARTEAVTWIDSSGKLWLFGGFGYTSVGGSDNLNDLWEFDPSTGNWTWLGGSNTTKQFGIYGVKGTPDAADQPGARNLANSWTDRAGYLWLFGGRGLAAASGGSLNDLWRLDPVSLTWTWMRGADTADPIGSYGVQGTTSASNEPRGRMQAVSWTDSSGVFWLFGGEPNNGISYFNDLWKYETGSGNWTWIKGTRDFNQIGTYGVQGTPAAANTPGARYSSTTWTDSTGGLWLFGGVGRDSTDTSAFLNDLWRFDTSLGKWAWMKGPVLAPQIGTYGLQGNPSPSNAPGPRQGAAGWTDRSGAIWLFGGFGYDGAAVIGQMNDLWRLPSFFLDSARQWELYR